MNFQKMVDAETSWSQFDANAKWEREHVSTFGVQFLDDALDGLAPNDLVLIAGGTGGGKTEMASILAERAAIAGKRIAFYALEAEVNEITYRIAYRKFMSEVSKDRQFGKYDLRYSQFLRGHPESLISRYKEKIDEHIAKIGSRLMVRYAPEGFTAEQMAKELDEVKTVSDMIVIDHLHYFDLDDENENKAMKSIVKNLRTFVLMEKVPVVLVAHIRKQNEFIQKLVPSIDDIHGSSDTAKICTKAIMMASGWDKKFIHSNGVDFTYPKSTLIKCVKARRDGTVRFYTAALAFAPENGGYDDKYILGTEGYEKNKVVFKIASDIPQWAKNAKIIVAPIQDEHDEN